VALTAAGRVAIEAAAPLHVEHVRKWFLAGLTPEQLGELISISETILAGLDLVGEPCGSDGDSEWPAERLEVCSDAPE
jgi:hypothetical protein